MHSTLLPDKASRFPLRRQLRSVLFTVAAMLGEVEVTLSLLERATIIHQWCPPQVQMGVVAYGPCICYLGGLETGSSGGAVC